MNQPEITAGDFVQVRRNPEGGPVQTAEGTVDAITATTITLGTETYDAADDWEWELVRSSRPLPKRLSEILAQLFSVLEPVVLVGRGTVWTDPVGQVIPVDDIRWYEEVEE